MIWIFLKVKVIYYRINTSFQNPFSSKLFPLNAAVSTFVLVRLIQFRNEPVVKIALVYHVFNCLPAQGNVAVYTAEHSAYVLGVGIHDRILLVLSNVLNRPDVTFPQQIVFGIPHKRFYVRHCGQICSKLVTHI